MSPSPQNVFFTLKQILKAKGISYRELGRSLNLSEAGVKKMFQAKDCSISRVARICEIIGIPIIDLFEKTGTLAVGEVTLSKAQAASLSENPNFLSFYEKLAFERRSVKEIQRAYRLTDGSIRKYLKKLEELGLVEVHPQDRLKFAISRLSRMKIDNPKLTKLRQERAAAFINAIDPRRDGHSLGTVHLKLKKSTLMRFQADLLELIERYYSQSEVEQNALPVAGLSETNLVIGTGSHSWIGQITDIV